MIPDTGEGEELVHAGEHRQLLCFDSFQAGPVEDIGQVVPNGPPRLLEPLLRIDLLRIESINHLAWFVTKRDLVGIGERMRRVGRHHQCSMAEICGPNRRGCGNSGLPHATFPGDEDDPHQTASSARFFKPRSAVPTICFSACLRRKPGTVKLGSTRRA